MFSWIYPEKSLSGLEFIQKYLLVAGLEFPFFLDKNRVLKKMKNC